MSKFGDMTIGDSLKRLEDANRGKIKMRCPRYGLRKMAKREAFDPPQAATCVTLCPECVGGDFSEVFYEDAQGRDLVSDDGKTWRVA